VGAFGGDFAVMDGFRTGISSGLLADAFAAAQNTFNNNNANDSWALAETNVGQLAFYVQDDWNINDNFKFSYGIRFDKPLFFDSAQKAQDVIDGTPDYFPGIPYINPNSGQVQQLSNTQMPSNDWLVSPRLGFNYDVKGDSSLQLRGGTGLFTGRFPFVWLGNQIGNPNFWFQQNVDPDYKFPQVWRTSFGADVKLKDGTILTTDIAYTKDINGAHVQNWGLTPPTGTLQGVDSRAVYTDSDHVVGAYGSQANAYVFTNSDKGRTLNASLKAQKTFDNGLYLMAAYNFLDSKDVNSIEAEITGDAFAFNPILSNANSATLAHSKYGDRHRFIAVAAKSWNYGANNEWTTTLSSFYELAKGGRFNYTYAGDINNDGSNLNDLIYIPTTSEIGQMDFSTATDASNLENFINQDDYLKGRRGQYAERYGALTPWRSKMDVKFIQNLKIKDNNSLEFSIDILNFGNLLNSDWGLVQQPNAVQPIGVSVDASGSPTYSFNSNLKETFVYNSTLISRWQMQFGLRYSF
ncbi:MAG: TonB-dependent receptor, partial [Polaribacter sp.]